MTPEYLEKIRQHLIWSNPDEIGHKITLRYARDLKSEIDRLNKVIANSGYLE